jgi:acyl-coenzyme A synthetase/AMP-(fatty) acid ligase
MPLREDTVDLDVTSLHHRRAVHRWERMSVGDLIERVTWSRPDKVAIVGRPGAYADEQMRALTYRQADQVANQMAHALLAGGLDRGDVVLLFCENSVEAYLAKIGIAKAGLVAAPLNPMMAPDLVAAMIAEMIDAEGVTALWAGSPAMIRALDAVLAARPDLNARSLTVIVYGWAALPPATLASMKRHCGDDLCVFEIFGQTESISCYRFWPDEWPELYAATAPQHN